MDVPSIQGHDRPFRRGTVVEPAGDLGGVQTPDGGMVPRDRLGPGIVEKLSPDGQVRVRWMVAEFDSWMDPEDLTSRGEHAHVLSIYRCDGRGHNTLLRHKVVEKAGFDYNWTVELRPKRIVRVLRTDGATWTFRISLYFKRIETFWPQPPEDDDAEAVAVAELAIT
jgi:hypothetical protein